MEKLKLNYDGTSIEIDPSTLLVFLDETGEQSLSDTNAPFFGLGGLVVEGYKYFNQVENPWHNLKTDYFDGISKNLHASELRNPTNKQIECLNNFFSNPEFGRIAVTCTDKTIKEISQPIENLVAACIWDRIKEVANKLKWLDILMIYEENNSLLGSFKQEIMSKAPKNSKGEKINVKYFTMLKDPIFAGMEVADFIIHTAGRQARIMRDNLFEKKIIQSQPDFKHVFENHQLQSYLSISRVTYPN